MDGYIYIHVYTCTCTVHVSIRIVDGMIGMDEWMNGYIHVIMKVNGWLDVFEWMNMMFITSSVVLSLVSSLLFSDVMGMVGGIFSPLDWSVSPPFCN